MSKRFIALICISIFVFICSTYVLQAKNIAQPLIIPLGPQIVDENNGSSQFSVSYLVNRMEKNQIQSIQIGNFKIHASQQADLNSLHYLNEAEEIQNYPYYDLYVTHFTIQQGEIALLKESIKNVKEVTAVFTNDQKVNFPLSLEFHPIPQQKVTTRLFTRYDSDKEASVTLFSGKEQTTIEQIKTTYPLAQIELLKEGEVEVVALPYELQIDEQLHVQISPFYQLSDQIEPKVILYGKTANGKSFSEEIPVLIDYQMIPSTEWIENFVKEMEEE